MLTWILGLFTFILILWKFSSKKIKFFEDHGISSLSSIPFFGSMWKPFLTQQPYPEWMLENTHKFRKNHFYGLSNFGQITFMIQDPDIIKQICIKEFDNFTNHPNVTITHHDKLLFNSLSNLQDERWKDMRSILSPAFTGSKMRLMFDLIRECASDFVSYCIENLTEDEKFEINSKEIFSKVTMDVISTVAFGLKVDSLRDPENEVYKKATNAFDIQTAVGQFKLLLLQMCPKLGNKLGLTMTKKEFNEFFIQMISESLDHRRNTKSFRPDIIQLLIQAQDGSLSGQNSDLKEGSKKFLTDLELISQCFIFYFAGFETTAALLNFAAYELALNDDVQERLFNEIQETKAKLQGEKITYVILQEMQYLDAFISEVLRVYPPGFITDRLCNHKTEIKDFNGNKISIPEGAHVWFNIYGLHHSHKYFPNSEKFWPDRFLQGNKHQINLSAYMPFGVGPRNCIGSRFALMDAKIIIYSILSQFKFEVCDKTLVPIRFKAGFGLVPKVDLIFNLKRR